MEAGNSPREVKYKPWLVSSCIDPTQFCVSHNCSVHHSLCWISLWRLERPAVFQETRKYAAKDYHTNNRINSRAQKKKKIGSMASCRKYPWGNIVVNSAEKRKKRNLQWKELRIGLFKQHYTRAVTEKKIK